MDRQRLYLAMGILALLVGAWVAAAPFSRPLPGGAPFSFEATPEVNCQSPLVGSFRGDRPLAEVYVAPRPQVGDRTMEITIDCGGRARFRLSFGVGFALAGLVVLTASRSSFGSLSR